MSSGSLVRWAVAALVGVSSVALVGGCGGKDKGPSEGEGAGAPTRVGGSGGESGGGDGELDVCGILDDAAVERALGEPAAGPGTEEQVPGGTPLCSYVGQGLSNMSVQYGSDEQLGPAGDIPEANPVSGLGDEAYERDHSDADSVGVYVLTARTGDLWLQFSVYRGPDHATVQAVMAEALESVA